MGVKYHHYIQNRRHNKDTGEPEHETDDGYSRQEIVDMLRHKCTSWNETEPVAIVHCKFQVVLVQEIGEG